MKSKLISMSKNQVIKNTVPAINKGLKKEESIDSIVKNLKN